MNAKFGGIRKGTVTSFCSGTDLRKLLKMSARVTGYQNEIRTR
jgi:hypothetical protein